MTNIRVHKITVSAEKTQKHDFHALCTCHTEGRFATAEEARGFAQLHADHMTGINTCTIDDQTLAKPETKVPPYAQKATVPAAPPPYAAKATTSKVN